jgi:hypothetical protein
LGQAETIRDGHLNPEVRMGIIFGCWVWIHHLR